jgi:hypothetical protein
MESRDGECCEQDGLTPSQSIAGVRMAATVAHALNGTKIKTDVNLRVDEVMEMETAIHDAVWGTSADDAAWV